MKKETKFERATAKWVRDGEKRCKCGRQRLRLTIDGRATAKTTCTRGHDEIEPEEGVCSTCDEPFTLLNPSSGKDSDVCLSCKTTANDMLYDAMKGA